MKEINIKSACAAQIALRKAADHAAAAKCRAIDNRNTVWATRYSEESAAAATAADNAYSEFVRDKSLLTLTEAVNDAQTRCAARKVSAQMIVESLCDLERYLGISKSAMDGISVTLDLNAQSFPNAYKGIPESTIVSARYKSGAWRITDISRSQTHSPASAIRIEHTDASRAALIERYTRMSTSDLR